ncbi:hypothetical protein B0H19DRAFT_1199541 [Mycena capillaripes]|nr:hypothetical protein B0H19DRAFT_1203766 [Mycena capillaripes]KAJ6525217.1 hypothetical protein B0H19DRAFT_1199541 [Mycena capillaripes]
MSLVGLPFCLSSACLLLAQSDLRYCLHSTPQYLYFPRHLTSVFTHISLVYLGISFHPSVLLALIARPPLPSVHPYAALTYSPTSLPPFRSSTDIYFGIPSRPFSPRLRHRP